MGHGRAWFDRLVSRTGPEVDDATRRALDDDAQLHRLGPAQRSAEQENVIVERL